jgi:hypothetical protein
MRQVMQAIRSPGPKLSSTRSRCCGRSRTLITFSDEQVRIHGSGRPTPQFSGPVGVIVSGRLRRPYSNRIWLRIISSVWPACGVVAEQVFDLPQRGRPCGALPRRPHAPTASCCASGPIISHCGTGSRGGAAAGVAHHEAKRDARHEAGLRLEHIGLEALRPNSAISRLAAAAATISYGAAYNHRAAAPTQSNGVREILQLQ